LEDDRDRAQSALVVQAVESVAVVLHVRGQAQQFGLFGRSEVVVLQEVPGHGRPPGADSTSSSAAMSASQNSASSVAVMVSGGAIRMVSGRTALASTPFAARRAVTSAATGSDRAMPRHRARPR